MPANFSVDNELEQAICSKVDSAFKIALRDWGASPASKESITKREENISRGPGHRGAVFQNAINISVEYELLPLIKKLIQIEYELRVANHTPLSEERIQELSNYFRGLIKERWGAVVYLAYSDTLEYAKKNSGGTMPEYQGVEIDEMYQRNHNEEPTVLYEMVDELIQQAAADSKFQALAQKRNSAGGGMFNQSINKTTILFVAADPTDGSRLRLGQEYREINEQLKLAKLRDHFILEKPELSVRTRDVSGALLDTRPNIVHFSGHGSAQGALVFEDEIGHGFLVQPDALAALFEQFTDTVDCVLLNACYSEIQAQSISQHINYVIGMNKAIGDKAAIAFALGFYQALGAGVKIEDAYKFGCVQIRLQGIPEHLTPVLIKKL